MAHWHFVRANFKVTLGSSAIVLSASLSPVSRRAVLSIKKLCASQGARTKLSGGNTPGDVHLLVPLIGCVLLALSDCPANEYCVVALPETPAGTVALPLSAALVTA